MWPVLAAASVSEAASLLAKQWASLAVGTDDAAAAREPHWATANTIALELKTVRLRDFSIAANGIPTLLCAPFALHGAAVVDLAPGHSLVAALRKAGLKRLFVTDWRSAVDDMRFLRIDDYLADLNVLVDELGGAVDLIGLCQGGWLSLLYAARFPAKVRKLVLAGAPIDIAAAPSALTSLVEASPPALFQELVALGDGRVLGRKVQRFWGPETVSAEDVRQMLQTPEPIGSPAFAKLETIFRDWYAWTVDLPGPYYLEVIEKLYRRNEIATGQFVALGKTIDLMNVRVPLFLLAAHNDELIAPAQLFATERLVRSLDVRKETAQCRHAALFMGKNTLDRCWPRIVGWMLAPVITSRDAAE